MFDFVLVTLLTMTAPAASLCTMLPAGALRSSASSARRRLRSAAL